MEGRIYSVIAVMLLFFVRTEIAMAGVGEGVGECVWGTSCSSSGSSGSAGSLDDFTIVNCASGVATIPAASGLYRIPSTSGCVANDTISIPDLGTLDTNAAKIMSIMNDSGVSMMVDASANTGGIVNESGSSVVADGSTFTIAQIGNSEINIIGTGEGQIIVHSWSDIEKVMRAHDIQAQASGVYSSVARVSIRFAEDFQIDRTSTTPHEINFSTGGGDHGYFDIDLGGKNIDSRSLVTLSLGFGGASTKCGTPAAYRENTVGCMGVAHDSDIVIRNGGIFNSYSGCDSTPNATCGRRAVATREADLLWQATNSARGVRITFVDVKFGGDQLNGDTLYPELNLPGDSCVEVEPTITALSFFGGQADCANGVTVTNFDSAYTSTGNASTVISTSNFRWTETAASTATSGTSCVACLSGFANILEPMWSSSSPGGSGGFSMHSTRIFGPFGNTRGGIFDVDLIGLWPGSSTSNCYDPFQGDESYFIDNGTNASDVMSGTISFSGEMCVRGWIRTSGSQSLRSEARLVGNLPGFLSPDSSVGANRFPVVTSSASSGISSVILDFDVSPRIDPSAIDYSGFLDANITNGSAMSDSRSEVRVNFEGSGFISSIGTTPTVVKSSIDDAIYDSGGRTVTELSSTFMLMAVEDMDGGIIMATDASAAATGILLPSGAPVGSVKCFYDDDGTGIVSVAPPSGVSIRHNGVTKAAGLALVSSGSVGDYSCFVYRTSTLIQAFDVIGTWS